MNTSRFNSEFYDKIKPVQIVYGGKMMRSKLEATWAAFFDLLGWQWEYEPRVNFTGWAPDFVIHGVRDVYCEAKPVVEIDDEVCELMWYACHSHETLLLGECPIQRNGNDYIGWINQSDESPDGKETTGGFYSEAALGMWEEGNGIVGFCNSDMSFTDRISGGYDGGCYGSYGGKFMNIPSLWSDAKDAISKIQKARQ